MSLSAHVSEKAALIWAIADKLTGVYKPHEYGEVILPLTVIRRFDCILADTEMLSDIFQINPLLNLHFFIFATHRMTSILCVTMSLEFKYSVSGLF